MKALQLNPKIIDLNEIPDEGRHYQYSSESAELNSSVEDLLKGQPYNFSFDIKPMGNAFEIRGEMSSTLNLVCSRCSIDFDQAISENIQEILMVEGERPRASKSSRVNHSSELLTDGPFCNYLNSSQFDVGEYLHEIIASAEPIQPLGSPDCYTNYCKNYEQALKEGWIKPEGNFNETSPFSVLKDLKI